MLPKKKARAAPSKKRLLFQKCILVLKESSMKDLINSISFTFTLHQFTVNNNMPITTTGVVRYLQ